MLAPSAQVSSRRRSRWGSVVCQRTEPSRRSGTADTVDLAPVVAQLSAVPERRDGSVRWQTTDPQRDLLRLLTWAEGASIELDGLEVDRPNLDDVFLRLTGDDDPAVTP